jgi:hypothetical protein
MAFEVWGTIVFQTPAPDLSLRLLREDPWPTLREDGENQNVKRKHVVDEHVERVLEIGGGGGCLTSPVTCVDKQLS